MKKSWVLIIILLMISLPSISNAVGMGNFVDEVYLQTETVGKVLYSHSAHLMKCDACHPKVFIKQSNSNHVSMEAMEQGRSCGACHNGDKIFSVTANCLTCHNAGDILYKVKDAGNVTFSHAVHTDLFSCDECHPDMFKADQGANKATMEAMEEGESCGACHDGSSAFSVAEDCESCHDM